MASPKKQPDFRHLAIAGNIGSGKTTLAKKLADAYGWNLQPEDLSSNPYLEDFYEDMKRWGFHMQIHLLVQRFNRVREIREASKPTIQDRTIYEDADIFAPNLHEMGLIDSRDYANFRALYETMSAALPPPDLMIYLKASVGSLVTNIERRGRKYEDNIRLDYLKRLNSRYDEWAETYTTGKILIVNVDECNFADDREGELASIVAKIESQRAGLFD